MKKKNFGKTYILPLKVPPRVVCGFHSDLETMTTLSSPNDGANDDKSIHQQQQKLPRHFPPLGNNIFHYRSCSSAMCFVKLHFCSLGFGKRKYWRFLLRRWGDELWLGCVYIYDLSNAGRGNGKKIPFLSISSDSETNAHAVRARPHYKNSFPRREKCSFLKQRLTPTGNVFSHKKHHEEYDSPRRLCPRTFGGRSGR